MIELPRDRMDQVLKRFEMIEAQMAAGPSPEAYVKLASEYSELQEMAGAIRELRAAEGELASDLGAAAARLFDRRIGFWTALTYATLPAVSVSSTIASTDAPLLTAWAAGLYALVRLREQPAPRWWALLGLAVGLGLLAKYAMAGFVLSLALWLALDRKARAILRGPGPWIAGAVALAALAPNLIWNLANQFATVRHVGENTNLARGVSFMSGEVAVARPSF